MVLLIWCRLQWTEVDGSIILVPDEDLTVQIAALFKLIIFGA